MADDAVLTLQLLGPVRGFRGPVKLQLGSAHRRTVLAVLALSPGTVVPREELVDALWGDNPPASANGSIYTYISSLRHALADGTRSGREILESVGSGYSLRVPPECVDVHRFDALRADAQRARQNAGTTGDTAAALALLDEALRLWHGDALAGLPGPFAELQRTRLGDLRLATLEQRAEAGLAAGLHTEVLDDLRALAGEHPLRETPRELLIRALHESGQHVAALKEFADFREILIQTSGTEPSPALCRLRERVHENGRPAPRPVARATEHRRPPRAATFVGRADTLRRLRSAVTDVAAGHGSALLVQGPAGIGKSALLAEMLETAHGCRAGYVAADELGPQSALRLITSCLTAAGGHPVPLTAVRDEDAVPALVSAVRDLCAHGPLILVADDLHWADPVTLRAWRYLIRLTGEYPLLLVGACRPLPCTAELDQVRVDLAVRGDLVLQLGPLPDEAVHAMVEHVVGAPPGRELRRFVACAAGNPFYVREVAEKLVDEGRVVVDGTEAYAADAAGAALLAALPATIVTRITDHLCFLSDDTRETLRWAALLGDRFTVPELAAAAGRSLTGLADVVEEALAAGILAESAEWLSFRHPIVRQALYQKTPASMRVVLHRQLAERLAGRGGAAGRVAEQLTAATVPVDDWTTTWLAGNIASVAADTPHLAVDLLRQVVAQSSLSAELRETLTATLARLLFWLGREPAAEARLVLARTTDGECAAEMRWILAYLHYRRGELREAEEEVGRALAADGAGQWRTPHLRLRDVVRRGEDNLSVLEVTRLLDVGRFADDAPAALALARRMAPYRAIPGEVHLAGAVHSYWAGQWQHATEEVRTILSGRPESPPYLLRTPGAVLLVHGLAAMIAGHRGEGDHARDFLLAATRQSLPRRDTADFDPEAAGFLMAATALCAEQAGRPEHAVDALTPILDPGYPPRVRHRWLAQLTRLAMGTGDRDRAARVAGTVAVTDDDGGGDAAHAVAAHCHGLVTQDPDRILAAAEYYGGTDRVLDTARALEDAAAPLAKCGRLAEARTSFRRALAMYTRIGAGWDVRRAEARMRPYGIRRAGMAGTFACATAGGPGRLSR